MDHYLVISRCEDEPRIELVDGATLQSRLTDDEYYGGYGFLKELPGHDIDYFPSRSAIIFKAEIVIPKPVATVTKFEI